MKKSDDDSAESSSENEETTDDPVWTVVDRQTLNDHLEKCTLCRFCGGESVSIEEVDQVGLGAVWNFKCSNPECPSQELNNSFHATPKGNRFHDLNRSLVLGMRMIGRGYSTTTTTKNLINLFARNYQ